MLSADGFVLCAAMFASLMQDTLLASIVIAKHRHREQRHQTTAAIVAVVNDRVAFLITITTTVVIIIIIAAIHRQSARGAIIMLASGPIIITLPSAMCVGIVCLRSLKPPNYPQSKNHDTYQNKKIGSI